MCGIAGYIRRDSAPADNATITRMTSAVSHRGPDADGIYLSGVVAFGHRRLSILDLSESGRQPMESRSGDLAITYNGEVYNYIELRDELSSFGFEFQTATDTEVILAAYEKWGTGCVERFNGMWSFAILDKRNNLVFCSRDRFGVKPFYYIDRPDVFAFGSEIRQLLGFMHEVRANRDTLQTFLVTGLADAGDDCFFEGVRRLSGGHSLTYDLATHRVEVKKYYELRHDKSVAALSESEALDRFSKLLNSAVELRLRSDVKVGTCLSGGLDSSTVADAGSRIYRLESDSKFSAITAVSEDPSNDESNFAQQVVDCADLQWFPVKPDYSDFRSALSAVVRAQEEPFGSPSIVMQYFVMKTARDNGITVLLDGQGGDETLLGYEKYYVAHIASVARKAGPLAALSELKRVSANNSKMNALNIGKYLIAGSFAGLRYNYYKRVHNYIRTHQGIPVKLRELAAASWDDFRLQRLDITSTNLPILLRYEDKNSMAHGIEARLPFLDYRLVEFCLSLPVDFKIRDGWTKWILRKFISGKLPDAITWRKYKFGFEAPDNIWLRAHHDEMKAVVGRSSLIASIADMKKLAARYDRLDNRSRWRLYSVALWEQQFSVSA